MSVPPDAYPPENPSAYLNAHYKFRRVETFDGEVIFEKIHLACDSPFSHKHPNPSNDALHVMNCTRASFDNKKAIAMKCKGRNVQEKWLFICAEMDKEQSAFLMSDDAEAGVVDPVPSSQLTGPSECD